MTTSANVRQSLKKKKSRDVEKCLKQTEMSFEPGMLKQQRWCKIVYQGIPSEFFCLKWAEWLSMCESYLAHLVGQLVYSEGWTCWSKAGHLPHTPTLLRPAPFHKRNSRKKILQNLSHFFYPQLTDVSKAEIYIWEAASSRLVYLCHCLTTWTQSKLITSSVSRHLHITTEILPEVSSCLSHA